MTGALIVPGIADILLQFECQQCGLIIEGWPEADCENCGHGHWSSPPKGIATSRTAREQ